MPRHRSQNKDGSHVATTKCYFCQKANTILLHRQLRDISRLEGTTPDTEPCTECQSLMTKGIIVITISDKKSDPGWNKESIPNPYRTGGWFVVRDTAFDGLVNDESIVQWAKTHRFLFIEHRAAEIMGLFHAAQTQAYRRHVCAPCDHVWYAGITLSDSTPSVSGEASAWCPLCNKKATESSPVIQPGSPESVNDEPGAEP